MADRQHDAARVALTRAVDCLLAQQSPGGWWSGEPETNASIDAQDVLTREFLGIRTAEVTNGSAVRIRSRQQPDGTWSLYYEGPPHLSSTCEAYLALRLAGDPVDAPHMARAAAYIRDAGGIKTSVWTALFGLRSWDDVPVIPPELILLPSWCPFNVYDWATWTRLLLVPIAIIGSLRPVRELPFDVGELRSERSRRTSHRLLSWSTAFDGVDRAMHRYERRPIAPLRAAARRRCADWLLARQTRDGMWDASTTHTSLTLIALRLVGYGPEHHAVQRGLAGLDRHCVWEQTTEGVSRRVDVTQSPHWDTAHALVALTGAGVAPTHPALVSAAEWMLGQEVRSPGDWQVRRPRGQPGGWTFQFSNEPHPDNDDTAAAVLALRAVHPDGGDELTEQALGRAVGWLTTMQSRDGGWGAFDADNTRKLCNKVPFVGFGGAIDPPSADVTAHVVKALCREGGARSPAVARGVAWLLEAQDPDGSWMGRWGVNHVYGTGLVLQGLHAAGIDPQRMAVRRAVTWLQDHQNDDGGWGEDPGSYTDATLRGRGDSTASQTSWALLGLLAAQPGCAAIDRGIAWLVEHQQPDGNWNEPQFTGTMFPEHMCVRYDFYRLIFPISALGRYAQVDR